MLAHGAADAIHPPDAGRRKCGGDGVLSGGWWPPPGVVRAFPLVSQPITLAQDTHSANPDTHCRAMRWLLALARACAC